MIGGAKDGRNLEELASRLKKKASGLIMLRDKRVKDIEYKFSVLECHTEFSLVLLNQLNDSMNSIEGGHGGQ